MPRALKVYRTPIGFHDAYVAAPTQKAALAAWGTDRNLFARGDAEIVTDPKLTKEPLSKPGTVFKRSRGSAAAQFAALGSANDKRRALKGSGKKRSAPRPHRSALDAAESALEDAIKRQDGERRALDAQIAALEKTRQTLLDKHQRERAKLEKARDMRASTYERALERWRSAAA